MKSILPDWVVEDQRTLAKLSVDDLVRAILSPVCVIAARSGLTPQAVLGVASKTCPFSEEEWLERVAPLIRAIHEEEG